MATQATFGRGHKKGARTVKFCPLKLYWRYTNRPEMPLEIIPTL